MDLFETRAVAGGDIGDASQVYDIRCAMRLLTKASHQTDDLKPKYLRTRICQHCAVWTT